MTDRQDEDVLNATASTAAVPENARNAGTEEAPEAVKEQDEKAVKEQDEGGSAPTLPNANAPENVRDDEAERTTEETNHPEPPSVESKINLLTAVLGLVVAIIGIIELAPWMAETFGSGQASIEPEFPPKKVESVVRDIVDEYFHDSTVEVKKLDNGEKAIEIHVYTYNDTQVDSEQAVKMAETLYKMTAGKNTGIAAIQYVYNSATGKATIAEGVELNFPLVIWWVLKTPGSQGEDIWVSDYVMATREIFHNHDIFKYEYDRSEIFHSIHKSDLDLDEELYSESFDRAFNR